MGERFWGGRVLGVTVQGEVEANYIEHFSDQGVLQMGINSVLCVQIGHGVDVQQVGLMEGV